MAASWLWLWLMPEGMWSFTMGTHTQRAESLGLEVEALGRKAYLLQADLSDPAQVETLISRASQHGTLFALVNNAAIFESLSWQNSTLENWNNHLMVNLTVPFLLSQAFARLLPADETGRIINLLDWRALTTRCRPPALYHQQIRTGCSHPFPGDCAGAPHHRKRPGIGSCLAA